MGIWIKCHAALYRKAYSVPKEKSTQIKIERQSKKDKDRQDVFILGFLSVTCNKQGEFKVS